MPYISNSLNLIMHNDADNKLLCTLLCPKNTTTPSILPDTITNKSKNKKRKRTTKKAGMGSFSRRLWNERVLLSPRRTSPSKTLSINMETRNGHSYLRC